MPTTKPYGTWESPISPDDLVAGSVGLSETWVDDDGQVCWAEGRPSEAGRQVVVREGLTKGSGTPPATDLIPQGFNARTSVHEYGGGAWRIRGHNLFFSNFADQRVYSVEFGGAAPSEPTPITKDPLHPRGDRYADFEPTKNGRFLICVRERHSGEPGEGPDGMVEAVNELVAIAVPWGEDSTPTDAQVLASGHDFYAAPRLSPDGRRLSWMTWDHPNMPWDGAELWVADLDLAGASGLSLRKELLIAGGKSEAPTQARWLPDGSLVFASDRSNWWNLYRWSTEEPATTIALCPMDAEFAGPQWGFGGSSYCVLPSGKLAVTWGEKGASHLGVLDPASPGDLREVTTPFTAMGSLRAVDDDHVALTGASPTEFGCVAVVDLRSGAVDVKRRSRESNLDPAVVSIAEPIEFPTLDGSKTAHALYYAPKNPGLEGPAHERPPLVVKVHGGPTGGVSSTLDLGTQFWTTRGFAVVDVNYGGSAGYGREYRNRLNGTWGVVDVEDSYAAAKFLCERGDAAPDRVVIRGGSAGGWTTLVAAIRPDLPFAAGCALYGISDLEVFVRDTHKFESRYIDGLVGPLPDALDVYKERSAMYHADKIAFPLLLLQGQDDKIVPPNQSELIVETLRKKGMPVAYIAYEGEGHGFRKAESVISAYCAELSFYAQVLGFQPAGDIPRVEIENLARAAD
ncbi:MAG TPA: prolyl oligopeptidase family serine peptidase [Acidimicrobiales bacterium]|nr:prolyl oligopeptidase family serine peptidase [Acidimicrobiales bacterium]